MRNQNPPPGSSSFGSNLPAAADDVPPQSGHVGPTATNTSSDQLDLHTNDEDLQPSEPTSLQLANAQGQLDFTIEGADEADTAQAVDGESINDNESINLEAGAPLSDFDMEETNGQSPMPMPQGASPTNDTGDISAHIVAPQTLTEPLTELVVFDPTAQGLFQQAVEGPDVFVLNADELETLDFVTGGHASALMPDNYNCYRFLRFWRWLKNQNQLKDIRETPRNTFTITDVKQQRITYRELAGDEYDLQGVNWQRIGVTRNSARKARIRTFRNFTNVANSDTWRDTVPDRLLSRHENYFRFRSMDILSDVCLLHFQLRNVMACASRTAVYYPSTPSSTIRELDPTTGRGKTAMRFKNFQDASITTLTAEQGFLVAGGFHGTYNYRRIETEDISSCYEGRLTDQPSGITNHVQVSPSRRSSTPLAGFASNDHAFRIVDLARNETIFDKSYGYALNCTALSPDKRLRVMVGDRQDVMITEAETGDCLVRLDGHRDYGFACDWAPDGWTVATGNQDKSVRIWDARKWKNSKGESLSVATVRAEMAGVRSLRFSPLGSGKRLLLAAEEADVINIIDAQTFNSKQTVDIFGELAGVSFASDGQEVLALSSDPIRGGVLCLERCDYGAEDTFSYTEPPHSQDGCHISGYDWLPTPRAVVDHLDSQVTLTQKLRQAAMTENWLL